MHRRHSIPQCNEDIAIIYVDVRNMIKTGEKGIK
jgi:hypothetical protein